MFDSLTVLLGAIVVLGFLFLRFRQSSVRTALDLSGLPLEISLDRTPLPLIASSPLPHHEPTRTTTTEPLLSLTKSQLLEYNGENGKPIYLSFQVYFYQFSFDSRTQGNIYDVTPAAKFYGPGEPWHSFAGHAVEAALGKQSLDVKDLTEPNVASLNSQQIMVMERWKLIFEAKYKVVGYLQDTWYVGSHSFTDNLARSYTVFDRRPTNNSKYHRNYM
jgi:membrane-associated progesterone receptor component